LIDEVLSGAHLRLRPVRPEDEATLTEIFRDPEVAQWWGDPAGAVSDALELSEGQSSFVVENSGGPIGFIQCFEEGDPMYHNAQIDIALRSDARGKGHGPEAIRILARHLIEKLGHHRLTIDPAAHNVRAIRAYERVGFKPVGVLRQYEQGPDGEWHDCLLMDMLAEELRDS
jgi:aminoglycoside 6'-N-acetyltransferase